MIKAVIWDLDGTLIDSEKHHTNAEITTLREYGIPLTQAISKEYMGYKLREYFEALAEKYAVDLPIEEALEKHGKLLKEYYAEVFPLVPKAREVLNSVSGNFPMGLATSAHENNAMAILGKFDLLDFFKALSFGSQVQNGKPDPEIFLVTAEKLGVLPGEIVVIEDSASGFAAAKKAGMKLIARRAAHNEHQNFDLADFVVEDLMEIPGILKNI